MTSATLGQFVKQFARLVHCGISPDDVVMFVGHRDALAFFPLLLHCVFACLRACCYRVLPQDLTVPGACVLIAHQALIVENAQQQQRHQEPPRATTTTHKAHKAHTQATPP